MTSGTIIKMGLGAVAAIGLVAVLVQPAPPERLYPAREKVVFWHMWSGEWQPIVEGACKRFNESQDKYEVVPLAIPPTGADTKFLLSSAGGHAPDLVSQWLPVKGVWADKGLLTPVEDVMSPAEKEKFLRDAYPVMKAQSMYRGKLTAAVASIDLYALYVRLDQLEEAGYTLKDIPTNLEDFVTWSRKLDRKDASGSLKRIGFLPQYGDRYTALFHGDFGTEDDPKLDTPNNRRAFQYLGSELKKIGFDKVQRFLSSQAADAGMNAPLLAGNFTTILDGQWRVKQAKDFSPKTRYAVIPMPTPKGLEGPASMTNANYLLIPKAGRNPKGAWEFIKYWIGFEKPEIGARNMAEMGWIPFSPVVAATPTYQAYLKEFPQYATFVNLMKSPYLITPPSGPLQAYVSDQLTKVDDSVSRGSTEPLAALAKAQKAIDTELARQRRLGRVK